MKLKIRQPRLDPRSIRVWLGEQEITAHLQGLQLSVRRGGDEDSLTRVAISIEPGSIDIDAETLAKLEAIATEQTTVRDAA